MTEPTPGDQPGAALRVLVLDDDPFILELMNDMLDQLGNFDVVRESDARHALRTLAVKPPELLVCDLSLPEMDGIEFLQAAAQSGFLGSVMLLSGMDTEVRKAAERLASAHGLRVLGSFGKPLPMSALQAVVEPLLAARRASGYRVPRQ